MLQMEYLCDYVLQELLGSTTEIITGVADTGLQEADEITDLGEQFALSFSIAILKIQFVYFQEDKLLIYWG